MDEHQITDVQALVELIGEPHDFVTEKVQASLSRDPDLLQAMAVNRRPALLVTSVSVEACFFHCGKAMIRSKTWDSSSWATPGKSPIVKQTVRQMGGDNELESLIETEIEKNYRDELY